jgi:hypothetical protein
MASLMATNFSESGLDMVLSAHLDSLAISPQAKQAIIPALLGMAKFTEVHGQARRCVHDMQLFFLPVHSLFIISAPVLLSRRL